MGPRMLGTLIITILAEDIVNSFFVYWFAGVGIERSIRAVCQYAGIGGFMSTSFCRHGASSDSLALRTVQDRLRSSLHLVVLAWKPIGIFINTVEKTRSLLLAKGFRPQPLSHGRI